MYDRGTTDATTEPRLPETCLPEASVLLLLALQKSVCQEQLTRYADDFEHWQTRLRDLGWHFEKSPDGKWISLAEAADPPVPAHDDYASYVAYRVLYANDGKFVRNTLKEHLLWRLWDYVKFANDIDGRAPRTVEPCLRRGENTVNPYGEDDEEPYSAAA